MSPNGQVGTAGPRATGDTGFVQANLRLPTKPWQWRVPPQQAWNLAAATYFQPNRGCPHQAPPSSHQRRGARSELWRTVPPDRKSTRLNSSHLGISYAV